MDYVSSDRPFSGWVLALLTPLLGEVPLHWHLLALLTRWLSAVILWWSLQGVWPQRIQEVTSVALLFAVYPGFHQQPIAHTCGYGYFIPLVLFLFSLGGMIWALRVPRLFWPLTILALPSSVMSMAIVEYFVSLELLRPLFLWLVPTIGRTTIRQRFHRTLVHWSPYLVVMGMFLIWRLFFFSSTRPATDQSAYFASFAANPLSEMLRRLLYALTDLLESSLMAWGQTFQPAIFEFGSGSVWVAWGLVLVSAIAVGLYLVRQAAEVASKVSAVIDTDARALWAKQAIKVGLFAILVGGLPIWFVDREIKLDTLFDRYTLPFMFGACLLLVGLIQMMIRTQSQQIIVISSIIGLAVGFHFRNANQFRQDWLAQKSLFWQLSWRVPGLEPGTSVVTDKPLLSIPIDYALAAPLNFIYAPYHSSTQLDYWFFNLVPLHFYWAPSQSSAQLDYWFFNLRSDLGNRVPRIAEGAHVEQGLRTLSFAGSTSNSLVVWFSPPSCLRVLDPVRDELPQLPPVTRAAQTISHVDRIITRPSSPARPPTEIFGPEPDRHHWCYYFQKADLARQMDNWQQVVQLGDEARQQGLKPNDATEWLPFLEGYIRVGRYEDTREITEGALHTAPLSMQLALCNMWKRIEAYRDFESAANASFKIFVADEKAQLSCSDAANLQRRF
jgi:hypothetical protein